MNGEQIAQKIKRICQQKNIPVKKLLQECSLSKGLIYDLEKRNISPSCDKILVISDYLNVSVDYLLGRADGDITNLIYGKKSGSDDDCLSDLEAELISKFRCLDDIEKGKIIERMDIMLDNSIGNGKEYLK